MKNYAGGKSTVIGEIPKDTEYKKIKDYVGEYEVGEMKVLGYIKSHSDLYNKDQYSLFIEYKEAKFLLNVPAWYGSRLEEDFQGGNETAEEFFNCYIMEIEEFTTKNGNKSHNIIIW